MSPHFIITVQYRFKLHLLRLYGIFGFQETETQYSHTYNGWNQ